MVQYSSNDFISHRIFISASSPFYIPVLGRNLEVQSYWWVLQTLRTKQSAHFWLQRRHLFFRLRKRERSRGRDLGVSAKLVTRSLQCAECFLLYFLYQDLCKKWIVWQVRWNQLRVFSGVLTQRDIVFICDICWAPWHTVTVHCGSYFQVFCGSFGNAQIDVGHDLKLIHFKQKKVDFYKAMICGIS